RTSARQRSSEAFRLVRHQMEPVDHSAELGKRTSLHLLHRSAAMHFHRGFGDADIMGDLLAQASASDLNHDLALPRTERTKALPEGGQVLLIFPPCTIAGYAKLNGVEEILIAERFGQELDGSPLHRLHGHRYVTVPRDEDDRKFPVCLGEF